MKMKFAELAIGQNFTDVNGVSGTRADKHNAVTSLCLPGYVYGYALDEMVEAGPAISPTHSIFTGTIAELVRLVGQEKANELWRSNELVCENDPKDEIYYGSRVGWSEGELFSCVLPANQDIDDAAELGLTLTEFYALPCGIDDQAHEFSALGGQS